MNETQWNIRFIELAQHLSGWSKDPSTKISAVAVSDSRQILSIGYNGFPRGISDTEERLNIRETKYKYVVHAEANCIYNACANGISLKDSNFYVFGLPACAECAKAIVQVGAKSVVCGFIGELADRWKESCGFSAEILQEADINFNCYKKIGNEWYQN